MAFLLFVDTSFSPKYIQSSVIFLFDKFFTGITIYKNKIRAINLFFATSLGAILRMNLTGIGEFAPK